MKNYKQQFKGKKITIMGLGLLGRGLGYTKFLAECGAELIVTDLKTKEQLATSLKVLSKFKNIKYTLGEHKLEDFSARGGSASGGRGPDMIIKAAGVPLDSIYLKEAKKNKIPIEMDVSLFIKSSPKIKVIGVTGTRGKSMTTALIYHILKDNIKNRNIYLGGNMRGVATLPLLKKIKEDDILVCELDSWQLQGFEDSKISPNISVFTSFMPDHMNYYKGSMEKYFSDKANIFRYQKEGDVLIVSKEVKKIIKEKIKSTVIIADKDEVKEHKFIVPGEHQRQNLAYAVEVAKLFNISEAKIKKSVKEFKGVEGRLQLLRVYKGIKNIQ
jgi:UDP-N-acetylmuramoylalanine--D-glutamate ligase